MKAFTLVLMVLFSANPAIAQGLFDANDAKLGSGNIKYGETKRRKNLEFDEGGAVEGLGANSKNFGELTVNSRKKSKGHLYNRIIDFDSDIQETIKNTRYGN